MYALMDVLGGFWYDECHKLWDTDRMACTKAGLGPLLQALIICANSWRSPYGTYGVLKKIKECALQFFANNDETSEYFLFWYEFLRLSADDTYAFGSSASLKHVYGFFKRWSLF